MRMLTVTEVAAALGLSVDSVYRMCERYLAWHESTHPRSLTLHAPPDPRRMLPCVRYLNRVRVPEQVLRAMQHVEVA